MIEGQLFWSSAWRLVEVDNRYSLSAGADLIVELDDSSANDQRLLRSWANGAPIDANDDARLIEQLQTLGVVQSTLIPTTSVTVAWIGEPWPELIKELQRQHPEVRLVENSEDTALSLVVRTNASIEQLVGVAPTFQQRPHLFIDVALHHTLALGPFVFPGSTACIGCLGGRIRQRWGNDNPPSAPAVQHEIALVAALVGREVLRALQGESLLINATVTWDLSIPQVQRNVLYRVPACPVCGGTVPGRLELPWI